MKKYYFMSLAAAALLASCSSKDELPTAPEQQSPVVENETAERIVLGAGSLSKNPIIQGETRAQATDVLSAWANTTVGIFALSDGATDDWTNEGLTGESLPCLINNDAATVTGESEGLPNYNGGITLSSGAPKTYPLGDNYKYKFFGYYPREATAENVLIDDNGVTITSEFNGSQDITAGVTASSSYNNKVIRDYKRTYGDAPTIVVPFNHMTAQLKFKVVQGESFPTSNDDNAQTELGVRDITIDLPTSSILSLAKNFALSLAFDDEYTAPASADCSVDGTQIPSYGTWFDITDNGLEFMDAVPPVNDPNGILFVPATSEGYEMTITYNAFKAGSDSEYKTGTATIEAPENGFEAGKAYTIFVLINGPESITLKAMLSDWVPGENIKVEF